jgi:hypothetical protein
MSIMTTLPRLQIADHCEQQSLDVDAEIREMLEQRFRCKEHICWLEQQIHAELQWRSFQQRFEQICERTNLLRAKAALMSSSKRLLPPPSELSSALGTP